MQTLTISIYVISAETIYIKCLSTRNTNKKQPNEYHQSKFYSTVFVYLFQPRSILFKRNFIITRYKNSEETINNRPKPWQSSEQHDSSIPSKQFGPRLQELWSSINSRGALTAADGADSSAPAWDDNGIPWPRKDWKLNSISGVPGPITDARCPKRNA